MHAQDRGPLTQALPAEGDGARKRFGGRGVEDAVDHRLARKARQYGVAQCAETVQARQQLVILFGGLGEAEAGVEDDVFAFDPGGEQVGGLRFEVGRDLGRDVAFVVGEGLHGPGIALHVHGDVGHAAARGRGGHLRVEFPGGDVVDDERTEFFDRTGGDFAAEGIDRNQDAGRQTPHGPDAQLHASPLLVDRDFVGAGA